MSEEPQKGQWRECEIAGVKRLVWFPPPGSLKEGQLFPFLAYPLAYPADGVEVAKEKELTEDELWRKDYEAARKFAYHAHALRDICDKYAAVCKTVGCCLLGREASALQEVRKLAAQIDDLWKAQFHKQPHQDTVFISPIPPEKEQENV